MDEYIKREDAFKTLIDQCKITGYGGLIPADVKFAFSIIPNADVRENVHAHLRYDQNGMDWGTGAWRCSACNSRIRASRFCPNCGAIMDEEARR